MDFDAADFDADFEVADLVPEDFAAVDLAADVFLVPDADEDFVVEFFLVEAEVFFAAVFLVVPFFFLAGPLARLSASNSTARV